MDTPLLWHIPLSHYSEKARWALDYKRIAHHRQVLCPGYLIRAWRATGRGTLELILHVAAESSRNTRMNDVVCPR
jgi:Glutathione S-transferase, N-terminal domain